jgi:tetratricopeptide (TPR) repeat protein
MALATANSLLFGLQSGTRFWLCLLAGTLAGVASSGAPALADEPRAYAQTQFRQALERHAKDPGNLELAWQFGRACFDLAECATNRAERAEIAQEGAAACRQALVRASNSAPAHYYLGMNLGQLARTKGLGALKLVGEMRQEFSLTRALDEQFDYAGPDRNLGLLYRDAPAVTSIGNRSQARQHLQRAVALVPNYPENRLSLIEALLKWGEREEARREFMALEATWPAAREQLAGPAWAASWADWDQRRRKWKKKVEDSVKTLEAPRSKS